MATYYVRTDGNDSNTGLGSTTALAWKTFGKAFASGTAVVGGDTVYIAPGVYTENITIAATSPSSEVNIIGDPTATQFNDIPPGFVRLSSYNAAGTLAVFTNTHVLKGTSKNYYSFQNIHFDGNLGASANQAVVWFVTSRYIKFTKCLFTNNSSPGFDTAATLWLEAPAATAGDFLVDRCIFGHNGANNLNITGKSILSDTSTIKDCLFLGGRVLLSATTATVYNSTFIGSPTGSLTQINGSANAYVTVTNSLFLSNAQALNGTSGFNTQTFCRFAGNITNIVNFPSSTSSQTTGNAGVDIGYTYLNGLNPLPLFASYSNSPNLSFGTATGAPLVDLYNKSWAGTSPDAGAVTLSSITGAGYYIPTERNASTITIAPGSTSQSIELYLGATGLTASTSGLSARYNRTRTASVSIPLVARTIAQAWTAGGFAEVDATNMPGVYRLDVPDAALAAGADDVTIVVRGASGTNGAVMTVKLSSGGLTEAQTASAVWGASPVGYNDATTFGGVVNQIDQTVTGIDSEVGDIPSMVWEELRTNHTTSGSFGQYVNAELLTPITSAALVRMGPYEVKADGLGASDPLDIQKGAQHGVDIQCVDGNGNGIDITCATVTAKVYNSGATLVDTYSCTATYAADGRATFTIDTTVTNTPGTYTATITRTTGASDTQIFGPLRIYVRDI